MKMKNKIKCLILSIKPLWSVKYLVCYGCMSIYQEEEFFHAWTHFGAWKAFRKHYGKKLPNSYQCIYDYSTMFNDISKVRGIK